MGDSRIELVALDQDEAARIAVGTPGARDDWAPGFPRRDDRDAATVLASAVADPHPFGCYRLVAHGQTIGTAGFFGPPDESGQVTIGYGMVEQEWGRGYGTEAVARLIQICRHAGDVRAILADTEPGNLASQRVLAKNGFEQIRATQQSHYFKLDILNGRGTSTAVVLPPLTPWRASR
jgi:RimJ/RimL family protein N-acetyltransferase